MSALGGRRRLYLVAAVTAAAIGIVVAVVAVARSRTDLPARCADGMIVLGTRCCGEGQRLDAERCVGTPTRCARDLVATSSGCVPRRRKVPLAGGVLHVGPGDWEAQGVVERRDAAVDVFLLDAYEVTEERWAECTAAGACAEAPLSGEPGRAVSGVTRDEAAAFCAWAGGALPTADQLAFAAAGAASRRYAWGDTGAVCRRAAWGLRDGPCARGAVGPEVAGAHPDGASPDGIADLAGNVAEWTRADDKSASLAEARGGSWEDSAAASLRSWSRVELASTTRSKAIGLRCAYAR